MAVVKATMYRVARKRAVSGHPFDRKTADASNRHNRMRNKEFVFVNDFLNLFLTGKMFFLPCPEHHPAGQQGRQEQP